MKKILILLFLSSYLFAQPSLLLDIEKGTGSSDYSGINFIRVNSNLFFTATNTSLGSELYITDGTPAKTKLVKDIYPILSEGSSPKFLTEFNGQLLFAAQENLHGLELWISDGTDAGTHIVKDINPGSSESMSGSVGKGRQIISFKNKAYFFAKDKPGENPALWETDGTEQGTIKIFTFNSTFPDPNNLTIFQNNLYFTVKENSTIGYELYSFDISSKSLKLVKDITSNDDTKFSEITSSSKYIYFVGQSTIDGNNIYVSDGTEQGTKAIKKIIKVGFNPAGKFTFTNDKTFFFTNDSIFVTDGSSAGTINLGLKVHNTNASNWVSDGDKIYFEGINPTTNLGYELYQSDGTIQGTKIVKDLNTGSDGSDPAYLTLIGKTLYFVANDGVKGSEIYYTDGTSAGTKLLYDIVTGPSSSSPRYLKYFGSKHLFFYQNDNIVGLEPYSFELNIIGTIDPKSKLKSLQVKSFKDHWEVLLPQDINIKSDKATLQLYDLSGKILTKININGKYTSNILIPKPTISGVYYMQLYIDKKSLNSSLLLN
ncbi:MAG: T9SS type A sorting domain-containing protein [Saprospiraceae bacterium]|nr:T9SS type A sorting domain-containing protein [Saprospiraceae bacterium]